MATSIIGPVWVLGRLRVSDLEAWIDSELTLGRVEFSRLAEMTFAAVFVGLVLGSAAMLIIGARQLILGLDGWNRAQRLEDSVQTFLADQVRAEAHASPKASKALLKDEGDSDIVSEAAASDEEPQQGGTTASEDSGTRNRIVRTPESLEEERKRREITELGLRSKFTSTFGDTHEFESDKFWKTVVGQAIRVDLGAIPKPGLQHSPFVVEFKVTDSTFLVERAALQLANVAARLPGGTFPTRKRGRPPFVATRGLLVVIVSEPRFAARIDQRLELFNSRSDVEIGALVGTEEKFAQQSDDGLRENVRSALTEPGIVSLDRESN